MEGADVGQWLVSGAGSDSCLKNQVLKEIIELICERPDVQIVRMIDDEIVVIRATIGTVETLQVTFGDRIIITSDKSLQLL